MKLIIVGKNEAGQRLDKLLAKYLSSAPKSFLYKMLRKKNITLNSKKATGNEKTVIHDEIRFFLSDETFAKFSQTSEFQPVKDCSLDIIYEDEHILLMNKPCNMLSQKAKDTDISINEVMISYLLEKGELSQEDLKSFRPAVSNRLDRNTSGILAAGKSLAGLQQMAELFRDRSLHKFYRCLVKGKISKPQTIEGYLRKDESSNQVEILQAPAPDALPIKTRYGPLFSKNDVTLLEVCLITGRSHQIRAHLASIGHPIIGDSKYGDKKVNKEYVQKYGLKYQLLHSCRIEFPQLSGELAYLSNKTFQASFPSKFNDILMEELGEWGEDR